MQELVKTGDCGLVFEAMGGEAQQDCSGLQPNLEPERLLNQECDIGPVEFYHVHRAVLTRELDNRLSADTGKELMWVQVGVVPMFRGLVSAYNPVNPPHRKGQDLLTFQHKNPRLACYPRSISGQRKYGVTGASGWQRVARWVRIWRIAAHDGFLTKLPEWGKGASLATDFLQS
jgi:hypothetical protein